MSDRDITIVVRGKNLSASDVLAASKDVSSFTQAIADSKETSKAFIDTLRGFSGLDVGAKAQDYAKAVDAIGGASKLTASEQAKVNAVVTEAIAKYKALGQTAPAELQALAAATKQVETQTTGMLSTLKGVSGALGGAFAAQQVIGFVGHVFTAASEIHDMGERLGISAEAVQGFGFAATQAGSSLDAVGTAITKMNKNLGEGKSSTISALSDAGLKFADIRAMKPEEAFLAITDAIEQIPDPMKRSKIALELFGKGAAELLPAITEGFRKAADGAQKMSNDTVNALEAAQDKWTEWGHTIEIISAEAIQGVLSTGKQIASGLGGTTLFLDNLIKYGPAAAMAMAKVAEAGAAVGKESDKMISDYLAMGESLKSMTAHYGVSDAQINHWFQTQLKAAAATTVMTDAEKLAAITADLHAQATVKLSAGVQAYIVQAVNANRSTSEITEALIKAGIASEEDAIAINLAVEARKKAIGPTTQLREELSHLSAEVASAAAHHLPMVEILKLFGDRALKDAENARAFGMSVKDNIANIALDQVLAQFDKLFVKSDAALSSIPGMVDHSTQEWMKAYDINAKAIEKADAEIEASHDKLDQIDQAYLDRKLAYIHTEYEARRAALDKSAPNYQEALAKENAAEEASIAKSRADFDKHFYVVAQDGATFAQNLASVISAALSEVGNSLGTYGQELGGLVSNLKRAQSANDAFGGSLGIANAMFDANTTATEKWSSAVASSAAVAAGAMNIWNATANESSKVMAGLKGALSGAEAGAAFGPIGAAIGAAAGGLTGLLHSIFGETQGHKDLLAGNQQIADYKKQLTDTYGSVANLLTISDALGGGIREAWNSQNLAGAAHFKDLMDALAKKQAELNTKIGGTLSQIQQLGGNLDPAILPYLKSLQDAKGLTQDNIDLIAQLSGSGKVGYQQMEQAAQALGISTDALGQAYHDAKANADWQSVIDQYDILKRGGANLVDITDAAAGKIDDLVIQSLKFGTQIPDNMKPWIQQLIGSHKLLDENGQEITDISKLSFGGTMQTTLDTLNQTLKDLVDTLKLSLPKAAQTAADGMNDAFARVRPPKVEFTRSGDDGSDLPGASTGGVVGLGRIMHFGRGGRVPGSGSRDSVLAALTPGEIVINAAQQKNLAAHVTAGDAVNVNVTLQIGPGADAAAFRAMIPELSAAIWDHARKDGPTRSRARRTLGIA